MKNLALTILMNIFLLNISLAQNGQFAAGAFLYEVDCELGKAYIDLKIKAYNSDTEFHLGDQNYRLSFNPAAFVPGSVSIESELEISGLIETADGFNLYSDHTLVGSGDTIISYNLELLSGSGYFVTADEWVAVGRVSLDIANANECFAVRFHTQETFPPTYVSEFLGGTLHMTTEGEYMDLEACLSDYCEANETEELVTSIEELSDHQYNIRVLPTAVQSELTVQYTLSQDPELTRITIADMQGQVLQLHQKSLTGQDTFRFDVSSLPQGIYLVNTLIDGQWIPRKFVKI